MTVNDQEAPSAALPVAQAALRLVSDLTWDLPDDTAPVDRYLAHVYWRDVLREAQRLMTVECGLDLARLEADGKRPAQIRDLLADQGVALTDDGVSHLLRLAKQASATQKR